MRNAPHQIGAGHIPRAPGAVCPGNGTFDVRNIAGFALRFAVLFGLLVAPWPGFQGAFCRAYQAEARLVLSLALPAKCVRVERHEDPRHPWVDTRISVTDRRAASPGGRAPAAGVVLDSRSLGWMPCAMFLTLLGATPLPGPVRWRLLLLGGAAVQVLVALSLVACVANALVQVPGAALWRPFVGGAERLLVQNLWTVFLFPAVLWCSWAVMAPRRSEV